MELVLTGSNFTAAEAAQWGLVSRVVESEQDVVEEAVKVAKKIASKGRVAVQAAKEGVNAGQCSLFRSDFAVACLPSDTTSSQQSLMIASLDTAYELSLQEGLRFERRIFHQLFATVS